MPIPVIVISGFLGCGKTTFLTHLLPLCAKTNQKPVLIINEVGDVDVDGELLSDVHAEQVRLVGGCVCCTLQAQLNLTVSEIIEKNIYDVIIIECSGLSNPIDVANVLSAPALLSDIQISHIITLVDTPRLAKLQRLELAQSQIKTADIVILNKLDKLDSAQLENTREVITDLAKGVHIYEASQADIGEDALIAILDKSNLNFHSCGCRECSDDNNHQHHHSHSLPESFCTVAVHLPEFIESNQLLNILNNLPKNVIRAKGFAKTENGWNAIQMVFGESSLYSMDGRVPSVGAVLICIGQHLDAEKIKSLL